MSWPLSQTVASRKAPSRKLHAVRIALAVAIVALFLPQTNVLNPTTASAYSCSPLHCHAIVDWSGAIHGASTDISLVSIVCSGCNGSSQFYDDEIWVVEKGNCGGACWVEVGYTKPTPSSSSEYYFWADYRPCFMCGYNQHFVGQVQPNEIGTSPEFSIQYSGNNTWGVSIVGVGSNFGGSWQSTSNSMSPKDIEVGAELAGTSGASAPVAHFTVNTWTGTDGSFHYQTSNGTVTQDLPPSASWRVLPSQSSSGGDLVTSCC
jgi:hypothetical protein